MGREKLLLEKWKFVADENGRGMLEQWYDKGLAGAHEVTIPHTWNVEEETQDFCGTGWYEYDFDGQEEWKGKKIDLYFHAAYHDAAIWLNGMEMGRHCGSGYTPFTVRLDERILRYGCSNRIIVRVNNEYSEEMLPVLRSFDWANDGGLIRDVEMVITGRNKIHNVNIYAQPESIETGERRECADGKILMLLQSELEDKTVGMRWQILGEGGSILLDGSRENLPEECKIEMNEIKNVMLWHFDNPKMYTINISLVKGEQVEDEVSIAFGFKDFRIEKERFILNGEPVRLCGTEWMPGSDPAYGMAEPKKQLEKMLKILKESNCVLTRFHWQQDEFVYDWCDRNGILVQEEVPFWGQLVPTQEQYQMFEQQAREMIDAHVHHPSIVSWGVGNELKAQEEACGEYVKRAVDFCHSYDFTRPANYVSCTMFVNPERDAMVLSDVMMANEYIGTWNAGLEQYEDVKRIVNACKDKPMIMSEFGLCEPAFSGGDERRDSIFLEKMSTYRKFPAIAGTIYFSLNDYRTQIGETGEGRMRRRIHGSTELCGEPKPSYWSVVRECAPFRMEVQDEKVSIWCMDSLPCYMMKGYSLEYSYGLESEEGQDMENLTRSGEKERKAVVKLPDMRPGDCLEIKIAGNTRRIKIYGPTGFCCGILEV